MVNIRIQHGKLLAQTPFLMKNECASIPGGLWSKAYTAWVYPLTPGIAVELLNRFAPWLSSQQKETLIELGGRIRSAASFRDDPLLPDPIPLTKTVPWQHQTRGFHFMRRLLRPGEDIGGGALIAFDMGTGKTKTAIDFLNNFLFNKILVVCPKISIENVWIPEFEKHGTKPYHLVALNDSRPGKTMPTAKKVKQLIQSRALAEIKKVPFVTVVNYESAWRKGLDEEIFNTGFDIGILDEVHRIKSAGGVASKFFERLAEVIPRRLGLSGTPTPHSPLDIYGSYRYLDKGIFGTSITRMRARYAIMQNIKEHVNIIVGYQNLEDLKERMHRIAYMVRSEDVLDLPEFMDRTIKFELGDEERKAYDELEEEFCTEIDGDLITVSNALVKLLRLQQLTSGHVDGHRVGKAKLDVLQEELEGCEEPAVVFCRFVPDLEEVKAMCRKLKKSVAEISGRHDELEKFKSGNADVCVVQMQSGKESIDLTRARIVYYFSMGYSLGDYLQSRKRVHRPGQSRNVQYFHLVAHHTVDEKVMKALINREEVIKSVWEGYKFR